MTRLTAAKGVHGGIDADGIKQTSTTTGCLADTRTVEIRRLLVHPDFKSPIPLFLLCHNISGRRATNANVPSVSQPNPGRTALVVTLT
jgi:hypothetical protein